MSITWAWQSIRVRTGGRWCTVLDAHAEHCRHYPLVIADGGYVYQSATLTAAGRALDTAAALMLVLEALRGERASDVGYRMGRCIGHLERQCAPLRDYHRHFTA